MSIKERLRLRLERRRQQTLDVEHRGGPEGPQLHENAVVDCGWGRLIFGQTFSDPADLVAALCDEQPSRRDVALYVNDPHVAVSLAPEAVFLDPSHTFRLWLDRYQPPRLRHRGFAVRLLNSQADAEAVHNLYITVDMVPPSAEFLWTNRTSRVLTCLLAADMEDGHVLGAVMGVDHEIAFSDPEHGSSLWALAVDPQAGVPGVGQALVRQLAEHYKARGRAYMDLSVMYDNEYAIRLYEKLGFERVPVFALKHKNPYNEPLFAASEPGEDLNQYAQIILREAQRRGIYVEVLDVEAAYFRLSFGGMSVVCRESLSELTTAVAMSMCQDKPTTRRMLQHHDLAVPAQAKVGNIDEAVRFLNEHGAVVVKPARGEQGTGISVDVRDAESLKTAMRAAAAGGDEVVLEQYLIGEDLRIIVIDEAVVAAAVRRPAEIVGNGRDSVRILIEKQSRRRAAATHGESRIPLDEETERCVAEAGYDLDSVPPENERLAVRKTANLHTGGTIHDVTAELHPALAEAAVAAARALNIPVTGLDFIVPSVEGADYAIIEANERPGLANHEPQPTAERFVDLLFPQTVGDWNIKTKE